MRTRTIVYGGLLAVNKLYGRNGLFPWPRSGRSTGKERLFTETKRSVRGAARSAEASGVDKMKRWRIWLLTILVVSACLARQTTAITLRPEQGGRGDKTLVSWVALADTKQRGGSALTIQCGEQFDAIVFGERAPGKWMAGSEFFHRTQGDQNANAVETAGPDTVVQVAIVYQGDDIRLYRNGQAYAAYKSRNVDLLSADNHIAVFGLRHVGATSGTPLAGSIDDARIYGRALTAQEIQSLKPNQPSDIQPLAWWDFEGNAVKDRDGPLHAPRPDGRCEAPGRAAGARWDRLPGRRAVGCRCEAGVAAGSLVQYVDPGSDQADLSPD